jgi:three-Cys-motif partner protein
VTDPRIVGFWTVHKLDVLSDYLPAFNIASKKARGTVYLDLFAGTADNEDRDTGGRVLGSPRRALEAIPPFSRLYFFELPEIAGDLSTQLHVEYPGRPFKVVSGDSNDTIGGVLEELRRDGLDRAPIFAFLDPYNLGVRWKTLAALADFKRRRRYKVELWMLCFTSQIIRFADVSPATVTRFFGTEQWQHIHWLADDLDAEELREEYVNLLRWRLQATLGYQYTHAFEVKNTRGSLYHLVFATDNEAGFKIMGDLYEKAAVEYEPMRREAAETQRRRREAKQGIQQLFTPQDLSPPPASSDAMRYLHEEPWPPPGTVG